MLLFPYAAANVESNSITFFSTGEHNPKFQEALSKFSVEYFEPTDAADYETSELIIPSVTEFVKENQADLNLTDDELAEFLDSFTVASVFYIENLMAVIVSYYLSSEEADETGEGSWD